MHKRIATGFALGTLFAVLPVARAADGLEFRATLSRAQEVPPATMGLITDARIEAEFDAGFTQVQVKLEVEGGSRVIAAHFHCNLPGRNGPVAFGLFSPGPLFFDGFKAEGVLTNADFTGADCVPLIGRPVNNIAALAFAMRDGLIYANVHTVDHPGGEVRGQMLPASGKPDDGE